MYMQFPLGISSYFAITKGELSEIDQQLSHN